jgi:hypothetical protein
VRGTVRRFPEFVAATGLLFGYVLGGLVGAAVIGALIGGTTGLGVALWASGDG